MLFIVFVWPVHISVGVDRLAAPTQQLGVVSSWLFRSQKLTNGVKLYQFFPFFLPFLLRWS